MSPLEAVRELKRVLAAARALEGGASSTRALRVLARAYDMLSLRIGPGRVDPRDYVELGLDSETLGREQKKTYFSNLGVPDALSGRSWSVAADDKLLTYAIIGARGLPIPRIHAVCHPFRRFQHSAALPTSGRVAEFLANGDLYPLAAKPVQGISSLGFHLMLAIDAAAGTLRLVGEEERAVHEFADACAAEPSGYIFQEALEPHARVAEVTAGRLSTLRMMFLPSASGPQLFRCVWKVAVPTNAADLYRRPGNIGVAIDLRTGTATRAVTGMGRDLRTVERHPVSNRAFAGFELPDWEQTVSLAHTAAASFPGIPIQAWDVAVTPDGPRFLDLNVVGNLRLPQIVFGEGLYQGEFRDLIDANR